MGVVFCNPGKLVGGVFNNPGELMGVVFCNPGELVGVVFCNPGGNGCRLLQPRRKWVSSFATQGRKWMSSFATQEEMEGPSTLYLIAQIFSKFS